MLMKPPKPKNSQLDGDEASHVPLMYPMQKTISLRKSRLTNDSAQGQDEESGLSTSYSEAYFTVNHTKVIAKLTADGVSLIPTRSRRCSLKGQKTEHIQYEDILAVNLVDRLPLLVWLSRWLRRKRGGSALSIHIASRRAKHAPHWRLTQKLMICEVQVVSKLGTHRNGMILNPCCSSGEAGGCLQDPAITRGWEEQLNGIINSMAAGRPSRIHVFINPKSGSCKARKVWLRKAQPILQLAGVECLATETEYADHGRELVANMSLEDLEACNGLIAVGGDGLFQEILTGVMDLRREGGPRAAVAEGLRLAQIPAGSTDAVAWTLNGTGSPETAALHVALGDGSSLDVMRVDSGDGRSRPSVCYAAYGYMGDLLRTSERLRCLGPARYPLAGALALLRGRRYAAAISYLPAAASGVKVGEAVCTAGCDVCASGAVMAHPGNEFAAPATAALNRGSKVELENFSSQEWSTKAILQKLLEVQGEFWSVMAVVTPCRSGLSPKGLSPGSHLADGRLRLILVGNCSRWNYFRFLASIPKTGIREGQFPFVRVIEATAVRVSPLGHQSSWNVDGELLRHNVVDAQIHRSLVRTFARGIPP